MFYSTFSSCLDSIAGCFTIANLYIMTWITLIITIQLTYKMSKNLI
jgi:hypothetical protein